MDNVSALSDDDVVAEDDRPLVSVSTGQPSSSGGRSNGATEKPKGVSKRPAASLAVAEPLEPKAKPKPGPKAKAAVKATAKGQAVLKRPAGRAHIRVCKSLYKRDGVWGVKVDGSELLRAGRAR